MASYQGSTLVGKDETLTMFNSFVPAKLNVRIGNDGVVWRAPSETRPLFSRFKLHASDADD